MKEAKTEELLKELLDNKIDAALISMPTDSNVFESHALFTEPFFLSVAEDHPLASKESVTEEDLRNQQLILLEDGHCFRAQALDVCHSLSAKENRVFNGTSLETIREFITKGAGITLMPAMAVRKNDGLRYLPIDGSKYNRQVGLVWRKSCHKEPKIEKLISFIEETLSQDLMTAA